MTPRTGIVLAAGLGSRLADDTEPERLKPLTLVGGVPIVQRVLEGLQRCGCTRTVIVLGHAAERVRTAVNRLWRAEMTIEFVINPDFRLSNGLSVLCARAAVEGEAVLTMADHLLGEAIWDRVGGLPALERGAALLVDRKLERVFDMDDATKVRTRDGRIVAIGKHLTEFDAVDTGVFVVTDDLFAALDQVRRARGDASLSEGVQRLAEAGIMAAVDVGDAFWQDIDTGAMLEHAEAWLADEVDGPATGRRES